MSVNDMQTDLLLNLPNNLLLNVPTDILLNIFKFLRYTEVMKLLIVNKTFNNIINKNSKYIEFNDTEINFNKENINYIIKKFPKIKLYVDGRRYNNYLDYINNINELILFDFNNVEIDVSKIRNVNLLNISLSFNIANIESLKDKDCSINTLYCSYNKITNISPFIKIKTLYLYDNNNLSDISAFKYNNYDLIDLSSCSLIKDISVFKYCNVKKLILSYTFVEDISSIGHINNINLTGCTNIQDFSYLSTVEILNVSFTNINDVSFLKNIKILNLSNCKNITNVDSFVNNDKLEELDISRTNIKRVPFIKSLKHLTKKM
jgi:hypothetical protein